MKTNNNIAITGISLGDEAKARCAHFFAKTGNYRYTIRGGSGNAGHTIYHDEKKIIRHLIPSTDFSNSDNKAFLSSCMLINPEELLQEVKETLELFPQSGKQIFVDPDAFVIFDKHIQEDKEKNGHIGSTNKGVTPAYKDKIGRVGTKISHLMRDKAEIISALQSLGVQFKYVLELQDEMSRSNLIFEGSQSIQLDLNFGNYPFVTSSSCGLGWIYDAGFAFAGPSKVYGIAKGGYLTKAGGGVGKFTTELPEDEAVLLRDKGGEIGATTGRPRRIGAMDLPALKYSIVKGGITHLILTKLDVLDGAKKIKVCHEYKEPVISGSSFENAIPNYIELPGWENSKDEKQIRPFVDYVEGALGVPVEYISTGVNDSDMKRWHNSSLVQKNLEEMWTRSQEQTENKSFDEQCKSVGLPTFTDLVAEGMKAKFHDIFSRKRK